MPDIETVTLRNPSVIDKLVREMAEGVGRNATETAENLILEAAEIRKADRARHHAKSASPESTKSRKTSDAAQIKAK